MKYASIFLLVSYMLNRPLSAIFMTYYYYDSISFISTPAFVRFWYPSLYLKNNTYLQQQDSRSLFDDRFFGYDMPLRVILISYHNLLY